MMIRDFMIRHRRIAATVGAGSAILIGIGAAMLAQRMRAPERPADKARIEMVVRDYILAHPEIIPQAIDKLRERQSKDAYAANKAALETPYESAWAGDRNGDVTLVMFTDYACGYCRSSLPDIDRLIADDPKLKVVWREIPILGPGSEIAAKAGLAAARQGAFRTFHERMFAAGRPDGAKVSMVLRSMKLDLAKVQRDIEGPEVTAELHRNMELAGRIDDALATPTFVVNGQMLKGAVGYDALKQAIADARKRV
ncbi:DsbA family protein [Sphingomonas sp. Root720]|uniref:DsbA family protein n=2 Tax=Sphingomonas TaxID=13687 RepID=UPI0006FAE0CA|nr:DsbA family protein [Sphingomonas sp. Root720]KQX17748.1 disulfide bond formation protein DsbA [Sphingomonas sp. Root1294]KQY70674.1 disulfide bond formation protein DsbA [Sphingomonas sp. Root50]KRB91834.1 disulfide bond formation protein DsbA [Sphingomonas sp. Root720]